MFLLSLLAELLLHSCQPLLQTLAFLPIYPCDQRLEGMTQSLRV